VPGRHLGPQRHWNDADPSARRALIDKIWSEGGQYIDPLAAVSGRDQIDAVIAAAQQQFVGMRFRLAARSTRITTRPGSLGNSAGTATSS
jgi:hypothetical protein